MTPFTSRPDRSASLQGRVPTGVTIGPTSSPVHFEPRGWHRGAAKAVVLPQLTGATAVRIRQLVALAAAILLMDDSGSMFGTFGDDTGVRYAAAQSLVNMMRRAGGGRAAVVHWGTDAPAQQVHGLTDIRRGGRKIEKALQIPPTLGGNNLPLALTRAHEVLAGAAAKETPVIYVLTDGCEDLGADLTTPLRHLPASSVHVLLVDRGNGCSPALEAEWNRLPLGSFRRLDHLDTAHLAWQLGDVLADTLGLQMPEYPTKTTKEHR